MRALRISRSTLHRYAKEGLIRSRKLGKRYDYLDEDVFRLLNRGLERKTYIYARVPTPKQKKALENQIEMLKGLLRTVIRGIFADIASGINFDDRKEFFKLLDEWTTR